MRKNYVSPDYMKDSFTCPHCGTLSLMNYKKVNYFNGIYQNTTNKKEGNGTSCVLIATCQHCKKNIIWIDDIYAYPDIIAEEANADMPDSVKQLYNEAGLIYNKSPRAACALLRLAIDRLCNELGETDRDINKNIGSLVRKGLPQPVQQALDVVRVVGNKAVHPGQIAFDVDEKNTAIMIMRLLNIIVERMITEPKEIDSLYQVLPESVKNAVENRDKK
ncbi:DUF4145 domain-containing protein [uncultured Bacteroides sp.]|uniref:DUF4145 domain-containing protein n=1 Tax=uncultured Bacteroides sp. TaxID=162156 RepID=UPI00262C88C8|nr:DUF4145 domain-containing protein [uncultured Bacteroides sp.]